MASKKGRKFSDEHRRRISESKKGTKASEATKKKLSEINSGEKNHFFGKHHTIESKKKQSDIKKGKHLSPETQFKKGIIPWNKNKLNTYKLSEETKHKISESLKITNQLDEVKLRRTQGSTGRIHSEETKRKISKSNKGRVFSETHLRNMSNSHKGKNTGNLNASKRPEVKVKIAASKVGKPRSEETKRKLSEYCGERASGWRGGTSFEPYCQKFNNRLKQRIRARDNHTCQKCGKKENGRKLSIHHIHYDKENCAPDLVSLCQVCHIQVNANRDYWELFFIDLLRKRGLLI